jgi:hypothetical protein
MTSMNEAQGFLPQGNGIMRISGPALGQLDCTHKTANECKALAGRNTVLTLFRMTMTLQHHGHPK